jgi:ABC-type lipoprotein release transport system permease subunit
MIGPTSSTLRVAWRNLWRNRRRTGLAVSAIGLSVTLVLAYDGILRAYGDWMVETITGPMLGHVQVHAPGWRQDRGMDRTLRDASSLVAALRRDRDVAGASARVYAPALAARGEEGFTVVVLGIDAAAESGPMRLLAAADVPPSGRLVLVGRPLADRMGLRRGESVAVVGAGVDGSIANDLFTVGGYIESPVDFVNREAIVMDIVQAQELFAMPDEAHEIVVHARDSTRAGALASRLAGLPAMRDVEVLDWRSLAPEMVSLVELIRVAWVFVLLLVFVAAAAGVANTMLMATFERTRELGMLLALGAGPGRIMRLVLTESIVLGVMGTALGCALGVGLVAVTHRTGIDYAALTGGGPDAISFAGLRWSLRLYPSLSVLDVARVVVAVALTSLLASAWPAVRAARLQPARALRE